MKIDREATSTGEIWVVQYEIVPGGGVKDDPEHVWNRSGRRVRNSVSICDGA